jgi:ribose transport system substrate-binding protein
MKKILALVLAIMLVLSATSAFAEAKDPKDLHFVYVSPLLAHPVWLIAKEGFDQAVSELGIKGDWVGPQGIAPEEMAKLIETAVAQKADAIITQGLVPAAPVIAAIDAGIPVLVVDSDIPDANRLAFFGKDVNVQAQCFLKAIEEKLGADTPLTVSIQVAALNYQIAHDQIDAIKAAFASHAGGFNVVNITESKSDKMKSTTEWQNTFNTYPEINVAISLCAEGGPACANVVRDMSIRDKVLVYGVDDIEETLDLIRNGGMDGTVATSFFNYGYQATYWLYQNITEGKTPKQVINDAGTIIITTANVDTYGDALRVKTDLE